MSYAEQKAKITALIKETLATVCRSSMPFTSSFEIDGLIGITLDKEDVFLVKINECTTNLNLEQPRKSSRGVKRKVERKEEPVCQISILPPQLMPSAMTIPTEPCVQTLPIMVKQEALAAEGEVLLDTSGIILETSEEIEDPNTILQSVISPNAISPNAKRERKLLDPDKAAQRLNLQRMHTAKHNQYMKELRKKVILTEEEYESLQAERRKCRERGRLFRERQRLKKHPGSAGGQGNDDS